MNIFQFLKYFEIANDEDLIKFCKIPNIANIDSVSRNKLFQRNLHYLLYTRNTEFVANPIYVVFCFEMNLGK